MYMIGDRGICDINHYSKILSLSKVGTPSGMDPLGPG